MSMNPDPVAPKAENDDFVLELDAEVDEDHCAICLQAIVDRTLIPECSHEFCFECLMIWSGQSRRCPLCAQNIGDHLIHHIRSSYDYQKHFLPPLRTSPRPPSRTDGTRIAPVTHRRRERVWGPRDRSAQDEADALQRAVSRRRWIYQHDLYAKHVASNKYTRYRPYPTPAQFAASQDLISRMTVFLRRELLVWPNADVEFLVTFVISLMKSIDIRSESAIKLLAEFLDMDTQYVAGERHVNAEHFAHEIYCYLRSPYKDLGVYDSVVQYDTPPGIPPPPSHERTRRWEPGLASRSRSQSPNLRSSHSHSYPPSVRERSMRPELSPVFSGEYNSERRTSSRRPPEVSHVHGSTVSSRFRSRTPVKGKGKRRASARSLSPPESDICHDSPVARHERTGSPEVSTALMSSSLLENTLKRHTSTSCTPSPPRTLESNSGGTPVVSHGNSIAYATHTTDSLPPPLEGFRSMSHEIIPSSSSKSETPERLAINIDRARANAMRQPRYRSQRDSIIAHLRGSAFMPRRTQSLLTRMTDQTVTKLDVSDDADSGGGAYVDLPSRTAERSSGLSGSDDPSGGRNLKETPMTKAEAPPEAPQPPPPRTSSHAHLLGRLYDERATATEARLRTQARLRARLAAERRLLAQGDEGASAAGC